MAARPPGWDGEPRGEPGIHGIARPRRWDAVAGADAPDLSGDRLSFLVLPDGTVDADADASALAPLRAALGGLQPPYRAEAVRQDRRRWLVAASRIHVISAPELVGDEAEVVVSRTERTAQVDGRPRLAGLPALEQVGREHGQEFVVRAWRLRDDLWEVEASAL